MSTDKDRCSYKRLKECTVKVVSDIRHKVGVLIDEIENVCGYDTVSACVPMNGYYEVTLNTVDQIAKLIEEGLCIEEKQLEVTYVGFRIIVVSFMNIPHYISDAEIYEKLKTWKVTPVSEIRERFYKHGERNIADGTRFVKVKFPPEVASLPYATRFDGRSFYVKHDDQSRVCFNCLKTGHEVKNCPDYVCYRCNKAGHTKRTCEEIVCQDCSHFICVCEKQEIEDTGVKSTIETAVSENANPEENDSENTGVSENANPEENDSENTGETDIDVIITGVSADQKEEVSTESIEKTNEEVFTYEGEPTNTDQLEEPNESEWRDNKNVYNYNKRMKNQFHRHALQDKPASRLRLEQLTRSRQDRYDAFFNTASPSKRLPSVSSQELNSQQGRSPVTRERRI
ncbi:hypothetical protein SNE40_021120 [Patella caerulea]|uniref:CCHC-type domain-containing protein n=1 Tax=Patella caerulea TaxID=87958 RepID=A0AAN8FYT6_PATCE